VGHVRAALDQSGLARDTLLVFTTDHGLAMPRAKGTCYDPGTGTTLILRLPGRWEGGRVQDELLSNCDLLPTLTDLAGGPEPTDIDGHSFLGLLDGGAYKPRESIFSEMTWHDKYNPMRAIRTRRHKYIRNFGDRPLVYLPLDVWNGRAGQEMREEYYGSRRPVEELYDLEADPLERTNLAGDPAHEETLRALRAEVEGWMRDTGDGLLQGDWPPTEAQRLRLETSGEPN
jgi:arylsulfatase A-like enzyme